jgi:hypothetical protein
MEHLILATGDFQPQILNRSTEIVISMPISFVRPVAPSALFLLCLGICRVMLTIRQYFGTDFCGSEAGGQGWLAILSKMSSDSSILARCHLPTIIPPQYTLQVYPPFMEQHPVQLLTTISSTELIRIQLAVASTTRWRWYRGKIIDSVSSTLRSMQTTRCH